MSFSIAKLTQSLASMPVQERAAIEAKLLADYARHAAFLRPLGSAGMSKMFAVAPGLEESALAEDAGITSIASQSAFEQAAIASDKPLLLIRSNADIDEAIVTQALEQTPYVKTVFIVR